MLEAPLTQEERRFAADNHRLIHAYLLRRGVPEEDYYGAAALGYLDAVRRYLSEPMLRRHALATIANRAMRRCVSHAMRARYGRRHQLQTVSLDTGGTDGGPLSALGDLRADEKLEEVLLLHALAEKLPQQQYELVLLRLSGYSVREIAAAKNISEKRVRTQLRKARGLFDQLRAAPSSRMEALS